MNPTKEASAQSMLYSPIEEQSLKHTVAAIREGLRKTRSSDILFDTVPPMITLPPHIQLGITGFLFGTFIGTHCRSTRELGRWLLEESLMGLLAVGALYLPNQQTLSIQEYAEQIALPIVGFGLGPIMSGTVVGASLFRRPRQ